LVTDAIELANFATDIKGFVDEITASDGSDSVEHKLLATVSASFKFAKVFADEATKFYEALPLVGAVIDIHQQTAQWEASVQSTEQTLQTLANNLIQLNAHEQTLQTAIVGVQTWISHHTETL
jgi:hypothetical protein